MEKAMRDPQLKVEKRKLSQNKMLTKNFFKKFVSGTWDDLEGDVTLEVKKNIDLKDDEFSCASLVLTDGNDTYARCLLDKSLLDHYKADFGNALYNYIIVRLVEYDRLQADNEEYPRLMIRKYEVLEKLKITDTYHQIPSCDIKKFPETIKTFVPLYMILIGFSGRWCVGGVIDTLGELKKYDEEKKPKHKYCLRFSLRDYKNESRNFIAYDEEALKFSKVLQVDRCFYIISVGDVREDAFVEGQASMFCNAGTKIIPTDFCLAATTTLRPIGLAWIGDAKQKNIEVVDLYVVVLKVFEPLSVGKDSSVTQDIHLADISGVMAVMPLWDAMVGCMDGMEGEVIGVKEARISERNGGYQINIFSKHQIKRNFRFGAFRGMANALELWYSDYLDEKISVSNISLPNQHLIIGDEHQYIKDIKYPEGDGEAYYTIKAAIELFFPKEDIISVTCKKCKNEMFNPAKMEAKNLKCLTQKVPAETDFSTLFCTVCPATDVPEYDISLKLKLLISDNQLRKAYVILYKKIALLFLKKTLTEVLEMKPEELADYLMSFCEGKIYRFRIRAKSYSMPKRIPLLLPTDEESDEIANPSTYERRIPSFTCVNFAIYDSDNTEKKTKREPKAFTFFEDFESISDENKEVVDEVMDHDGLENDGLENDGLENDGMENDGMENDGLEDNGGMENDGSYEDDS